MTAPLATCPNGHRVKATRVVYGMPDPKLMADAEAGRVRLGGCDPTFEDERIGDCPECGAPIPRQSVRKGTGS